MILGLKGKIHEIYQDLQKIRAGSLPAPGKLSGTKDVTLVEYLGAIRPEGCDSDGVFDVGHLYAELGINPGTMTVSALIDLDQDSHWLVPEIFRDAIRKGLRTSPFYNNLVALTENVKQPQVNMPYVDLSDAEPQAVEEAETIETGTISYGNKVVSISKRAIGIEITDEAVLYTSLNLLTVFIQDVGIKLGQRLNNDAIDALINGDQGDGSEAAAVIGVNNTTTGALYRDLLYAWIRASRLGRLYGTIVASEVMANKLMNLTEFKDKQAGTTQQSLVVNANLPSQSQMYVSAQVPDNQCILVDPSLALVQLISAPLSVEGERIVKKQISGTYASITTGFANIFRDARVVIDQSLALTVGGSHDFPAFMTPTL